MIAGPAFFAGGSGGGGGGTDPLFDDVALLLHGAGADGSTTFTDSSSYGRTISAFGNVQMDTAQTLFSAPTILFDGNGDYLQAAAASELNLAGTDFAIEMFFRPTAVALQCLMACRETAGSQNGWELFLDASGVMYFQANTGTPNYVITGTGAYAANTWQFVRVSRSGSTISLQVNDTVLNTGTQTFGVAAEPLFIGRRATGTGATTYPFAGHLGEIRITRANRTGDAPAAAFPNS